MPITLFATGGTLDKIYFDAKSEFHIGEPMAGPLLKEGNVTLDYHIESLLKKDSLDMTDADRQQIAQQVAACDNQHIIITHGTDTMVATAQTLAATLGNHDKTIVFVGAMQPARMRDSDAPFNLGFALAAVQLLEAGIYITMNGQIFPYNNVTKNREAGRFE